MDHDYLEKLKQTHPTLRLLAADNSPLIISFFYRVFIQPNQRSLPHSELLSQLEDYLFHLREIYGEEKYPKAARQYLEDWSNGRTPFLRKYYSDLNDEPEFDLTSATEKAIEWLQSLEQRQFIGTESRLLTVFQLLREIVSKTRQDPAERIMELENQRAEIDAEIERARSGMIDPYDPTQIKERFFQVEETARRLLADFRQMEQNFRALDRETRERIATSDKVKGKLLDEIFLEQDVIWDSDQGKSFRAFWEFLLSALRQAELEELLQTVYSLEEVQSLNPDFFLARIKFALLDAGEKVYKTNSLLVEQLRKFLDDQTYLENRRIMEIVKSIEKKAIALKEQLPQKGDLAELDDIRPSLDLIMARGLFIVPKKPVIDDTDVAEGQADFDVSPLYQQNYVDEAELKANIRRALQARSQVSLGQVVAEYPIGKGLAEVVTYMELAHKEPNTLVVNEQTEKLSFTTENGITRCVELPKIIFIR